jgi:ATP-binding cassette subfamily B protein
MKPLSHYLRRYWKLYLFGFVSMLISIGLDMMSPQITKQIINSVILDGQTQLLMRLLLGLIGIGLGRAIFQYAKEFTYDYIGVTVGRDMRRDLFGHVQSLSMDYFDRHNTGELMTRIKDDIDKVWAVTGFVGILAIEAAIHTVTVLVCMMRISPLLTLIPLVILPIIGVCAVHLENGLGPVYDAISEETAELNTVAQENLAGVRTVKAFAREGYEIEKFSRHNRKFYDLNMKQARVVSDHQPLISFLGKVLILAVIVAGGFLVIQDRLTLGELGAFSEYANNVIWPMEILGWLSNDIASAVASWKKIQKVAKEQPVIASPEMCSTKVGDKAVDQTGISAQQMQTADADIHVKMAGIRGQIIFDHVSLTIDGHEILRDVSFCLQPGQTLGIMGMTGAGKTTIINLLQRFYDVSEGRILLDGQDIRQLPLEQLRSSISVVAQDVFLFSDTVAQNVRTGQKAQMEQETVTWAVEQAGAERFVTNLSQKYETVVGERGVGLSGGQKQRLSIARAIAKHAPVLVLDDATSALDMETEKMLQKNLKALDDMTKIIIGHRISSVRDADEILVLDGHTVAERGTHRELMAQKGRYYQTWCVQYGENPAGMADMETSGKEENVCQ